LLTGDMAHTVWSPMSIAGLAPAQPMVGVFRAVQSASVFVDPPLATNPAGSSRGSVLHLELPVVVEHPEPVKPQVDPSSMLWPPSVRVPPNTEQFCVANCVFAEKMLLVIVALPAATRIAPALLKNVQLTIVVVPPPT
jgi:hypothetical protein